MINISSQLSETIAALATPSGIGAIGVIRLSGDKSLKIIDSIFFTKALKPKTISNKTSHTIHFGIIAQKEAIIDEVLVSLFKAPNTYTGEDVVEISCHGSVFIQQKILELLFETGAVPASPGEFTMRAFLNGKMDLSQAEAVSDLILSSNKKTHQISMQQLRGQVKTNIETLREQLIHFASMLELELDFSEEDVEFANRDELKKLMNTTIELIQNLLNSFTQGNAIKNGVSVAIIGNPNVGKSTLLNALLGDDKAIVSDIAGTTRDVIEDCINIEGVQFRFMDTAGIRATTDEIEKIGVQKSYQTLEQAHIILYVFDVNSTTPAQLDELKKPIKQRLQTNAHLVLVGNKIDFDIKQHFKSAFKNQNIQFISAKNNDAIEILKKQLLSLIITNEITGNETIITSAHQANLLAKAANNLKEASTGLDKQVSSEFIAQDLKLAIQALSELTGKISSDDLLKNIFSKFCIGK